jgi:hypothetical protein
MTEQRQNFIWLIYLAEKGNGYSNLKQSELVKISTYLPLNNDHLVKISIGKR